MPIEIHGDPAALFKSIVRAQSTMEGVKKAAKNPHFRSKYADLAAVIEATVPPLNEQGVAVLQLPGMDDDGVTLTTILGHAETGSYLESTSRTPVDKKNAQGVGSAITYLRRYALQAALALPAVDDDGNRASRPRERRQPPAERPPARQQGNGQEERQRQPTPQPGPNTGHHDTWEGNRKRFCADLSSMGFEYEGVAAWCDAHGKGRPSTWDNHRRGKLIDYLGDSGNSVNVKAWLDMQGKIETAKGEVSDG